MGGATEASVADIRRDHGLDRRLHGQLLAYAARVASGDPGSSLHFGTPVTGLVLARLGPTLLLAPTALLAAILLGTLLGAKAARDVRPARERVRAGRLVRVRVLDQELTEVSNSLIQDILFCLDRSPSPRIYRPGLTGDPWANRS